jgi:hypothetical protein
MEEQSHLAGMAAGIGIFGGEGARGNPIFLVLGVGFLAYAFYYAIRERKKPKAQREQEYRRRNERFVENVNRGQRMMRDEDASSSQKEDETDAAT